jgi:hypothetical protein
MPPPPRLNVKLTTPGGVRNIVYNAYMTPGYGPWVWQQVAGGMLGEFPYGCDMIVDDASIAYDGREEHLWSGTIATSADDADFMKTHTVKTTGGRFVANVVLHKTKARGEMKIKEVSFKVMSHTFMSEHKQACEVEERERAKAADEARQAESRKRMREESECFWARARECVDMLEALANGPAKSLMAERERERADAT